MLDRYLFNCRKNHLDRSTQRYSNSILTQSHIDDLVNQFFDIVANEVVVARECMVTLKLRTITPQTIAITIITLTAPAAELCFVYKNVNVLLNRRFFSNLTTAENNIRNHNKTS